MCFCPSWLCWVTLCGTEPVWACDVYVHTCMCASARVYVHMMCTNVCVSKLIKQDVCSCVSMYSRHVLPWPYQPPCTQLARRSSGSNLFYIALTVFEMDGGLAQHDDRRHVLGLQLEVNALSLPDLESTDGEIHSGAVTRFQRWRDSEHRICGTETRHSHREITHILFSL